MIGKSVRTACAIATFLAASMAAAPPNAAQSQKKKDNSAAPAKTGASAKPGPAPTATEKIYEVGGDVIAPKLLHSVEPDFDANSDEAFVNGVVTLGLVVTPEGTTESLTVIKGLEPGLDKKAMDAVKKWRFQPATKDGHPVPVKVTVEVQFSLM